MNTKFFLISTALLTSSFLSGLFTGRELGYTLLVNKFGVPRGEGVFIFGFLLACLSIASGVVGVIISLTIMERLGRRWGSRLSFGSHPVLKLTLLSFLTFLGLLVLLLFLIPTK